MKHSMNLEIDGEVIPIAANPTTKGIYKKQFKGDLLKHLNKAIKYTTGTVRQQCVADNIAFQVVWALAKTANKKIPSPDKWLDSFETFPVKTLIPKLAEILKDEK